MWISHMINPGAANAVSARHRFIDDYIESFVNDGLEQLVILGAGYDCRAFRMDELKKGITVFEVDHPATQDKKKQVLNTVLDEIPGHVVFVPYQLEEKKFGEQLLEQGYDKSKKSLFRRNTWLLLKERLFLKTFSLMFDKRRFLRTKQNYTFRISTILLLIFNYLFC